MVSRLSLPKWYSRDLVGNPYYQPNAAQIQAEAEETAALHKLQSASKDQLRIFRLHVDEQPDFTWAFTVVDPSSGRVTRYLPAAFKGRLKLLPYWTKGNNRVVWVTPQELGEVLRTTPSIMGGRLSVPGAWWDIIRLTEWDLENAAAITMHGYTMDFHPWTARFDMHYWVARANNPHAAEGEHPQLGMPGTEGTGGLVVLTPETVWHPEHNPDGIWAPISTIPDVIHECWKYVNTLGYTVLWPRHCHKFTLGGSLDPIVAAASIYHAHLRGSLEAEPFWFPKGISTRTDMLGVFEPEVQFADDLKARTVFTILNVFRGFLEEGIAPFDLLVVTGQAASHCVLRSLQQAVKCLIAAGLEHRVKDIVYLSDTASIIPGFEEETEKALAELAALGMRIETTESFQLAA
ncbi:MAG TPA: hypothetical protein VLA04_06705 [Verrucomicrobiae bacterium]|nr:hypothetical protein [Verrucomicrobiae bacterium]